MKRHYISLSAVLLFCVSLCAVGIILLTYPALPPRRRMAVLLVAAVSLGLTAKMAFLLHSAETVVYNSSLLSADERQLSMAEQFRHVVTEAGDSTRQKVTTALADKQAEVTALQSQINPHFLYNTLDSIRGQALIDGSMVIADMAEALSVIFRYSISRTGSLVPIREEIRCIEKYMMIQQFRFSGKFSFQRELDESLLGCLIPRLTLQPIVENAIFHGLEAREEGGIVTVRLERCGDYLVIRVSDNGVGISESQLLKINENLRVSTLSVEPSVGKRGSGIALSNISRRIRLTFGEPYGITVLSFPNMGTDVEISIPLVYTDDGDVAP